jgi:hypothetical protein
MFHHSLFILPCKGRSPSAIDEQGMVKHLCHNEETLVNNGLIRLGLRIQYTSYERSPNQIIKLHYLQVSDIFVVTHGSNPWWPWGHMTYRTVKRFCTRFLPCHLRWRPHGGRKESSYGLRVIKILNNQLNRTNPVLIHRTRYLWLVCSVELIIEDFDIPTCSVSPTGILPPSLVPLWRMPVRRHDRREWGYQRGRGNTWEWPGN